MLRTFGEEKLQGGPELQTEHAHYSAAFLQEKESALIFGDLAAIQAVQTEIDNLRVSWDWATTRLAYPVLEKMVTGIGSFYRLRGLFTEGVEAFSETYESLRKGLGEGETVPLLLGKLLVWQGEYLDELGRFQEAVNRFEEAIEINV